ncbi:hypothetical protein BJY00DRAFT_19936 [Aspergillus carlsbadensis]|nr:hypothetical protein BJY00DRAFT_19936 [Aspergillus carlsbadensis]
MRSVPGVYSPRQIKCRRRELLFDYSAARKRGIAVHGSIGSMEEYATGVTHKKLESYNQKASLHTTGTRPRQPRTEDPFDGKCSNPRRFMAIVQAPSFRSGRAPPKFGSHCMACKRHHYRRPLHWRRQYTPATFQDHIAECGEIVNRKHVTTLTGRSP